MKSSPFSEILQFQPGHDLPDRSSHNAPPTPSQHEPHSAASSILTEADQYLRASVAMHRFQYGRDEARRRRSSQHRCAQRTATNYDQIPVGTSSPNAQIHNVPHLPDSVHIGHDRLFDWSSISRSSYDVKRGSDTVVSNCICKLRKKTRLGLEQ